MTTNELEALCDKHEEAGLDGAILEVPRRPRGERIALIPGVLGAVLCVNGRGRTVALFAVRDIRRAVRRLREAEAALAEREAT